MRIYRLTSLGQRIWYAVIEKFFVKNYCHNHYFQFKKKRWLFLAVIFLLFQKSPGPRSFTKRVIDITHRLAFSKRRLEFFWYSYAL